MNFFVVFNEIVNAEAIAKAALYVDEPTDKTRRAVQALAHTIFGGLLKRTTSEIGVNQLFTYIQKDKYNGALTANIANTLKDPAHIHTLIGQGSDVIGRLLPGMKSSISTMIASHAGVRNSSAISLLGLTAALVLDVLGREVNDKKLDADGLAATLFDQREAFIAAVSPTLLPQLVEKVGIQQIVAGVAAPARQQPATPSPILTRPTVAAPPTASFAPVPDGNTDTGALGRWVIGLALLVVVGVVGFLIYQNTQNHTEPVSSQVMNETIADSGKAVLAVDTVARSMDVPLDTTSAITTAPKTPTVVAPSLATTIAAPITTSAITKSTGSVSAQIRPYLADVAAQKGRVFPLSGLGFNIGTTDLKPGAETTVTELVALLKENPTLQIQLIGYANDATLPMTNKSLSFKRVNAIKQQLITSGIDFQRVDAIGKGSGVKFNPNDSTRILKPPTTLRKIDLKVVIK
jgi:outer membrane protein OmpA-like peptidoglycan-associated protein